MNSCVLVLPLASNSPEWAYKKEHTFCGLNGLVLEETPVSRGS